MVIKLKTLLKLETAEIIVESAFEKGAEMGFLPLTVVVLDVGGNIILLKRQDGSGIVRGDVALGKGWASLGMGLSSGTIGNKFAGNPNFVTGMVGAAGGRIAPNPGGVLILNDEGEAIGAVGISGDIGPNDEICALAGVAVAGLQGVGTITD